MSSISGINFSLRLLTIKGRNAQRCQRVDVWRLIRSHNNKMTWWESENHPTEESAATFVAFARAIEDCKASDVATIRSIVIKVLSEPTIFWGYDQIKAMLLQTCTILEPYKNNNNPAATGTPTDETSKILNSLDLFSYGTLKEYRTQPKIYLDLTETQLAKLRQLTVLSVVQHACERGFSHSQTSSTNGGRQATNLIPSLAMIPYTEFEQALELSSNQESPSQVEDILISCLYMNVIHGKLCQRSRSLQLSPRHPIRPRDVPPKSAVPQLMEQIRNIQTSIQGATSSLTTQKQQASHELQAMTAFAQQAEERRRKNEASSNTSSLFTVNSAGGVVGNASASGAVAAFGVEAGGSNTNSNTRRQKRGRAATAAADPTAGFGRY